MKLVVPWYQLGSKPKNWASVALLANQPFYFTLSAKDGQGTALNQWQVAAGVGSDPDSPTYGRWNVVAKNETVAEYALYLKTAAKLTREAALMRASAEVMEKQAKELKAFAAGLTEVLDE